jgi:hypothetical protein
VIECCEWEVLCLLSCMIIRGKVEEGRVGVGGRVSEETDFAVLFVPPTLPQSNTNIHITSIRTLRIKTC